MTISDAYAAQRLWIDRRIADGRTLIGHKIGLTSRAMQAAVGIDEPDHGALLDTMRYPADGDIPFDDFVEPRIEVELAYVLGDRLAGPDIEAGDVLDATRYVTPALEIIDARVQRVDPDSGRLRTVRDTIADNAANAGIVLGGREIGPRRRSCHGWGPCSARTASWKRPASPPACLETRRWGGVARTPLRRTRPGARGGPDRLAGSFTRPVFVQRDDRFEADYGRLGRFSVAFA